MYYLIFCLESYGSQQLAVVVTVVVSAGLCSWHSPLIHSNL